MSSISTRSPTSPTSPNGATTTEDVHAELRALHSDELVTICPPTVLGTFYSWVKSYIKFQWMIWGHVLTLGHTDTETFEWTLVFAIMTTVLLAPMLVFCMIFSLPGVQPFAFRLYAYAVTTPMYDSWWNGDKRALAASRTALSKSVEARGSRFGTGNNNRNYDLDVARILLQFSGLVYEHDSTAIRHALSIVKANSPFDIFGALRGHGRVGLDKFIGQAPAQLARAALTGEEVVADVLGVDPHGRVAAAITNGLSPPSPPPAPQSTSGSAPGDGTIRAHLASSGIEYEPVSELNGVGSAYAALFWHPQEPWVVVAFKGTSPTEFDEWVTDLTFTREDIGMHIPGFGKGFKARVFPDEVRTPRSLLEHMKRHAEQVGDWFRAPSERNKKQLPVRTPYDSIREGIQIVADHLTRNTGIHSINVYFTGHSLGCATSSLAYARAVAMQNTDYKSNVRIRDAYLFAAPVVGDVKTRDAFNQMMGAGFPRSMWRLTNGPDMVAGMLPEMGDRVPLTVDPENPLAFAHLGLEIKMSPTGHKGRGAALTQAVVAPHRPTQELVRIVQTAEYGPGEEGRDRLTNDRDSGIFSDTTSEHSTVYRMRAVDRDRHRWNLSSVKKVPLVGHVLWLGVSHVISCYWVSLDEFWTAIVPEMGEMR
ncbi:hypothetical protein FRC10_000097 [Ceratobasidium sp. 414]|nr:hypothetical protein FRC10_000097 [Ceratobasidium sp. 414]